MYCCQSILLTDCLNRVHFFVPSVWHPAVDLIGLFIASSERQATSFRLEPPSARNAVRDKTIVTLPNRPQWCGYCDTIILFHHFSFFYIKERVKFQMPKNNKVCDHFLVTYMGLNCPQKSLLSFRKLMASSASLPTTLRLPPPSGELPSRPPTNLPPNLKFGHGTDVLYAAQKCVAVSDMACIEKSSSLISEARTSR